MKDYLTRRKVLIAAAAVGAVAPPALSPAAAAQGNMEAALNHLEQAIQSLRQAEPNKGGHRERAIQMCETAMAEVQAGIDYAGG